MVCDGEGSEPGSTRGEAQLPPAVRAAALGAFELRVLPAQVVELVFDSALDTAQPGDGSAARHLRFGQVESGVDVTLTPGREGAKLRVQPRAVRPGLIEIRLIVGAAHIDGKAPDAVEVDGVPSGLFSVVMYSASPDTRPMQTSWVRL